METSPKSLSNLIDISNDTNEKNIILIDNTQNKTRHKVSDREIYSIIKEEKRLPIAFSAPIKLSLLVKYYNKYWNNDFTDESDSCTEDDE